MTGGQKYYWQKMCQNVCEPEKSRIFAPLFERALGYGVMVTLQILVLPFLVRVRVAQRKRERRGRVSLFLSGAAGAVSRYSKAKTCKEPPESPMMLSLLEQVRAFHVGDGVRNFEAVLELVAVQETAGSNLGQAGGEFH